MTWLGEEIADGRTTTDAIEEDLYRCERRTGNDSWRFKSRANDHTPTRARRAARRRGGLKGTLDPRAAFLGLVQFAGINFSIYDFGLGSEGAVASGGKLVRLATVPLDR